MKRFILLAFCALPLLGTGQILLYSDGATIKVDSGAILFVEGGIQNTATGTIDNDGIIDLEGDFVNAGTWDTGTSNNILRFSGDADANVTPGPAVFQKVEITKGDGGDLTLLGDMTVTNNLLFNGTNNKIKPVNNDLILTSTATVSGADIDGYVAMTGTGMVQKDVTANGTFNFPVGDATNYSPLSATYTGSGYSSANLRATVTDAVHPSKPADASDFITRYWSIDQIGITNYENELVGTYIPADITGTAGLVKGASYNGADWYYADAAGGANTVTGTVNEDMVDFTGTNFFGKVDIITFLNGPYSTSTHAMNTALNNLGIIPLVSPYGTQDTVTSIPSGVTDWIKLELRDPASPATILGTASAFLKSDGHIVGLDGNSLPLIKNGKPVSIVNVLHRNHLPIRTPNAGLDVVNPISYNFSDSLAAAYDNPAITTNDAMRLMSDGKYVMWGGNANNNANVRYTTGAGDEAYLLGTVLGGNTALIITGAAAYDGADMNMNGNIRYTTGSGDEAFLLGNVLGGNTAAIINRHQ